MFDKRHHGTKQSPIAALMMGVGAVKKDSKTMILSEVAGLVGGAYSRAIKVLVSIYSLYDIEMSQLKRGGRTEIMGVKEMDTEKEKLPNLWQAAGASALAFSLGALLPLLSAAFIKDYTVRVAVVIVVVSLALLGFGWFDAILGKAPVVKLSLRVLLGGWLVLALTFGITKLVDTVGL